MEQEPGHMYEAAGLSLSEIKKFYDAVFPQWEAITLDPGNLEVGYIKYSETAPYVPIKQVDSSKPHKLPTDIGIFVVEDIDEACERVEDNSGEIIFKESVLGGVWCYCTDPADNIFHIVQHLDQPQK